MTWAHTVLAGLLSAVGCSCYEVNSYDITTTDAIAIPRTEAIECGKKYSSMNATGYRITNNGNVCEELPFTWLSNKIYETGYVYFVKSRSVEEFTPPLLVYRNSSNSVQYWSLLPCAVEPGSVLELQYTLPNTEKGIYISLMDESEGVQLITTLHDNQTKITIESIVNGIVVEALDRISGFKITAEFVYKFSMHITSWTEVLFKSQDVTFQVFTFQNPLPLASLRGMKVGTAQDSEASVRMVAMYSDF